MPRPPDGPISSPSRWAAAERHLARVDPALRRVVRAVGPCQLAPRRDHFLGLCGSIFAQQVSTAVAATFMRRFRDLFPGRRPTPAAVVRLLTDPATDEAALRFAGLSRQKRGYMLDLARHVVDGRAPLGRLSRLDDEAVIATLTRVNGVGRWTAEMFLIFSLNRPDVLPVDDLGLREAVRRAYGLTDRPRAAELTTLAEPWRPWRTIATHYLWRWASLPTAPKITTAGRAR